jgi:hypothetical protein
MNDEIQIRTGMSMPIPDSIFMKYAKPLVKGSGIRCHIQGTEPTKKLTGTELSRKLFENELRKEAVLDSIFGIHLRAPENLPLPPTLRELRLLHVKELKFAKMKALAEKLKLSPSDIADCFDLYEESDY